MPAMAVMAGMLLIAVAIMDVVVVVGMVPAALAGVVEVLVVVDVATPAFHACGIAGDGLEPSSTLPTSKVR
ncbi:expressed conserved protein [Echinococcus multilocularis]|uniref:Expressed conserved protein n=1 Tax=Echinococcus multilocularis TaxID=6211 RepID=A0A087VXG0_ECHMU|nr:expressed conserved protein [Echinococcus multilocularis]